MFKKVIVGHDGRAGGDDALTLARALAPVHQAPCPVLVVPRTAIAAEPDIPVEVATGALDQSQ